MNVVDMTPLLAVFYSFLFGLLHGILPDEHTWPITFSYAIGGATGKEGIKAGLFFSAAFTVQRALLSEVAYLALAPFLLSPTVNGVVYVIVGVAMAVAGAIVLRKNLYPHVHLVGHHHEEARDMKPSLAIFARHHHKSAEETVSGPPPVRWTIVHGFIAGFGFGGFSLFVNTVAAPAMHSAWTGFLPGLVFGVGTMIVLVVIGYVFGAALRWTRLSEEEIKRVGSHTGGRTLLFGGILFVIFGILTLLHLIGKLPVDPGYLLIGLFMVLVALPAFYYTWREVISLRKK